MLEGRSIRIWILAALLTMVGGLAAFGIHTFLSFRPAAITLGPNTTFYFREEPPLRTRVHEAIHRRQMRDKSRVGRILNAVRYNFDYGYRLEEEAEAKAGELCLQIHRFSTELPTYTTARSVSQAHAYRAWAWERLGVDVPDRVGEKLRGGENCHRILQGVELDLPPDAALSPDEALKLATFHFVQSYGSTDDEVGKWRARLDLAGHAEVASRWASADEIPPFGLVPRSANLTLPPDTSITAHQAGEALHRLTYYRAERMPRQLRPPLPGYRGRPLMADGEAEARVGVALEAWPTRLLRRAMSGDISPDGALWLEQMAAHPLHQDFDTFAMGPGADIVGTRYRLPFDDAWTQLALSDLEPIRAAFRAQWGRAALAVHEEDFAEAERRLRTVLTGAIQMMRNAPFEVDVIEALGFADAALGDLRRLRRSRGEERDNAVEDALENLPEDDRPWTRGARRALLSDDPNVLYRAMPALAADPGIPHAFKRLAYRQILLTDVCLESHRDPVVQREHRRWRTAVEIGLVRRESDQGLLEFMRRGVRSLLREADVPPERICSATEGVRPDARMAIMAAPLRSSLRAVESALADAD